MQPAKEVRVPDNQLHLTDAELDEEIAKMLTANNPAAPKALVRFIQKERAYKPEAIIVQTTTHFATDGWLLHRDSEDARKQLEQQRVEEDLQKRFMNEVEKAAVDGGGGMSFLLSHQSICHDETRT
jgi:dynein intermediate chain 1, axonemal